MAAILSTKLQCASLVVIGALLPGAKIVFRQGCAVFSCAAEINKETHKMKNKILISLNDIREKIAELQDEAQAIVNLAVEESKSLSLFSLS